MRALQALGALPLVAVLSGFAAGQERGPVAGPVPEPAVPGVADPMAPFARMVPDEWRTTAQSGQSMFHAWHWGPGKHSIRRMTDGSGAGGQPWREVQVFYRHPGLKQVRLLVLSPFARGVGQGTIRFEGEAADGSYDLDQAGGRRRKMGLRWAFDGPDKYRDVLLEAAGTGGYQPLVDWVHVRSKPPATPRPLAVEGESKPSERLGALARLLGPTWEAEGGDAAPIRTTFAWVPLADAIHARVVAPGKDGEPRHLLDAYFYHHTGTNKLRCLALSDGGGVYEGDLTAPGEDALQVDLKGYEGDRGVPLVVRLDFEGDGSLRQRVWSVEGTGRIPLLELRHRRRGPNSD